jgi:hypothetical protein
MNEGLLRIYFCFMPPPFSTEFFEPVLFSSRTCRDHTQWFCYETDDQGEITSANQVVSEVSKDSLSFLPLRGYSTSPFYPP